MTKDIPIGLRKGSESIAPISRGDDTLQRYTDEDIARFLEEDKIDPETAGRVRELLRQGKL